MSEDFLNILRKLNFFFISINFLMILFNEILVHEIYLIEFYLNNLINNLNDEDKFFIETDFKDCKEVYFIQYFSENSKKNFLRLIKIY